MWLSRQMKPAMPTADADLGVTTIAGEQAGVVTRGEVRALPVYGPGGYAWLPENGMAVLVIRVAPAARSSASQPPGSPLRRACSPARSISTAQAGMPYTCAGTGQ